MSLPKKEQEKLANKYGPWALITGASSGIGRAIAIQLAEAGLDLILVARRLALLEAIKEELEKRCRIQVRCIEADLAKRSVIDELLEQTQTYDVGLLVGAAGFGTSGVFVDGDLKQELNMLSVNCEAILIMTHHFARRMLGRGRGGIILLASMVGFQGVPYAAHYAATKAYVQSLGEALAVELKPKNVDVLAAAPGPVNSGFADRANMQMGNVLSPEQVAIPILKALGKRHTVLPGGLTKLLVGSLRTLPRWAKVRVMSKVMGGMTQHQSVS
ncbi:MAG: SDR family NAD(P)-dependent oxidoreductase [Saprospiraceae bacterium]|nr:SDR family NAD(P)-dependent oxidoreductase [Saprospiraceae bacterium]